MRPDPLPNQRPIPAEALRGETVGPQDPLHGIVWKNPERLSGAPCFYGTRVPVQNLFDAIESGESIESFLEGFPGVTRQQVLAVLELARIRLLGDRGAAA